MYICWFVRCRLPRKYKNPIQCTTWSNQQGLYKSALRPRFAYRRAIGEPCTIIEVEKHFCTTLSWFDHFVHCCMGLFTEWYGNLTNQQLFFHVNGPYVCSCLGLICLNLMGFACFWTFKIQNYRFCSLHWSDQMLYRGTRICYCSVNTFLHCTWSVYCTVQKIFRCTRMFFRCSNGVSLHI